MTAIRQFIKKSPLAYRTALAGYGAWKRVGRKLIPPQRTKHFEQSFAHLFENFPKQDKLFSRVVEEYVQLHGPPVDPIRIVHIFHQVQAANRLDAGDFIELGTHRGLLLKAIYAFMDPTATLYSFDTFEGFDERDLVVERQKYASQWTVGNFLPTSPEEVAAYVGNGTPPANLKVVKGWFPASFAGLEDKRWRFVHIDFDLYAPIKAALDTLWDRVVPGGVVMVHDYGCYGFPAARKAVDEFCNRVGVMPIELGDRWGTAAFRKPC